RMWPCGVVVLTPGFEHGAGLRQRVEQCLVEQLVPEAAVEALDEGVLDRLAGVDVVPSDAPLVGPAQHGIRSQLSTSPGSMISTRTKSSNTSMPPVTAWPRA